MAISFTTKDDKCWQPCPEVASLSPVLRPFRETAALANNSKSSSKSSAPPFKFRALDLMNKNGASVETLTTLAEIVAACDWLDLPDHWCSWYKLRMDFVILETIRQSGLANMLWQDEPHILQLSCLMKKLWPDTFPKTVSAMAIDLWATGDAHIILLENNDSTALFKDDPLALAVCGGKKMLEPFAKELRAYHLP